MLVHFLFLPLRKQFRWADAVFVGKPIVIQDYYKPTEEEKQTIPTDWKEGYWKDKDVFSKVSFEVSKNLKGNSKAKQVFIAVAYYVCVCDNKVTGFKLNEEYLVFSYGKNFVFVCDAEKTEYAETAKRIKSLDNFWFRTWARIYPF